MRRARKRSMPLSVTSCNSRCSTTRALRQIRSVDAMSPVDLSPAAARSAASGRDAVLFACSTPSRSGRLLGELARDARRHDCSTQHRNRGPAGRGRGARVAVRNSWRAWASDMRWVWNSCGAWLPRWKVRSGTTSDWSRSFVACDVRRRAVPAAKGISGGFTRVCHQPDHRCASRAPVWSHSEQDRTMDCAMGKLGLQHRPLTKHW